MDRRRFLWRGTQGLAGLLIARGASAQDLIFSNSNVEKLAALAERPLTSLAFGSCNYSDRDQSYWLQIAQEEPDLWIWLGDTIYGDGLTMEQRRARFQALKDQPFYAAFRAQTPVIGTWDDHDYGSDNQDASYRDKLLSKAVTLDFLDVPQDSAVQRHSGIYQSYSFGPIGQRTKVILLDLRYNQNRSRTQRTLLGSEQWQWLSRELDNRDAQLLIFGSSLNVMSNLTGFGLEGWNAFQEERQQLYRLIGDAAVPTIILSGDRHQAEFSRYRLSNGQPVYEFMSSGLTHAVSAAIPNPYRIGNAVGQNNYGLLRIDWGDAGPEIQMEIRSPQSNRLYRQLQPSFSA